MKNDRKPAGPDYYRQNRDFVERTVEAALEKNIFAKGSSIRIWHNEQTDGFEAHWHSALEIIIPVENYYDAEIDNRNYHVLPGDILIIPPRTMHTLTAPESGSRFISLFNIDFFSALKDNVGIQSLLKAPLLLNEMNIAPVYSEIYENFALIWKEYFGEEEYYEFSIYSHLLHIFTLLARFELSRLRPFAGSSDLKRRDYFDRLGRSLEYISLHYNEAITLDDAAALSGFSRYHFSRLFKEYMECTFYDYLTDLRVKAAEAMLAGEDLPITEIALRSGFLSISTFNRTFRQKNGCTPKEYRDLYSGRRQVAAYELK